MTDSIIFCGDVVLPFDTDVDISDIIPLFAGKETVINLEGAILPNKNETENNKWQDKYSLYSQPNILRSLKQLNVKYASLCNNHILDYKYPISYTEKILKENGIQTWGLKNHDIIETTLNDKKTYIITFSTFANEHSLDIYNPDEVVADIKRLKSEDCNVVVFPHWGIEKFEYPEPSDREHAHRCIDAGADIVIGHHPHIIQGIEIYKGKHIIYSVGNMILPQTYYGKKKLVYKNDFIQNELAIEWNGVNVVIHSLFFDKITNAIKENKDFNVEGLYMYFNNAPTAENYKKFFCSKVGALDRYVKMRKADSRSGELWCYRRKRVFRMLRKVLIKLGLHKPE